jgi:hypothetical protein
VNYNGADAIAKFRIRYGDCTDAAALKLLNEACIEVAASVPMLRKEIAFDLTAGVRKYPLGADYAKAWSARYVTSAGAGHYSELKPTSTDELDANLPGWRAHSLGTPCAYYLSSDSLLGGVIGLYPTPDAATTDGYPSLVVEVSAIPEFVDGSENFPDLPLIVDAVVDLMCFKRAKDAKLADAAAWKSLSDASLADFAALYWGRNPRKPQTIKPVVRQRPGWNRRSG